MTMTIAEHFAQITAWLQSNKLKFKSMRALFQVELDGDAEAGVYWLKVDRGDFSWGAGTVEGADCVVNCGAEDFKRLAAGSLSPAAAFMQGRIRIRGDIGSAMKFGSLLA